MTGIFGSDRMRQFITSTENDPIRAIIYQGSSVYMAYGQLQRFLGRQFGATAANILAEPIIDPGHGRIDWYSRAAGPMAPVAALAADQVARCRQGAIEDGEGGMQGCNGGVGELGIALGRRLARAIVENVDGAGLDAGGGP